MASWSAAMVSWRRGRVMARATKKATTSAANRPSPTPARYSRTVVTASVRNELAWTKTPWAISLSTSSTLPSCWAEASAKLTAASSSTGVARVTPAAVCRMLSLTAPRARASAEDCTLRSRALSSGEACSKNESERREASVAAPGRRRRPVRGWRSPAARAPVTRAAASALADLALDRVVAATSCWAMSGREGSSWAASKMPVAASTTVR